MIKKRFICLYFYIAIACPSTAQSYYFVEFRTKNILAKIPDISTESVQRKKKYGIPIDEKDFAIDKNYIQKIQSICPVKGISKWFNGLTIEADKEMTDRIRKFDFVKNIEFIGKVSTQKSIQNKLETHYSISEYAQAYDQIKMHNGQMLHDQGYEGQGMKIAVLDAGYSEVNRIRSFQHLFLENRITPIRNLVYQTNDFYNYDAHGTLVLGCMASYVKDSIVATAPKAQYYLFITEDVRSETKIEEYHWAIAAEIADSIGVDMINSSLGYHQFDDESTNYKPTDMDGKTAISTKAAAIAASKGILVVNSAGNTGKSDWRILTAPSDADQVVCVGAINYDRTITDFSARGYAPNNIIKPNVVAVGRGTILYYDRGQYAAGNGTSFASPVMAGLMACYWQKNRSWTSDEIRRSIYQSSHQYFSPNREFGFGIPYFDKASIPTRKPEDSLIVKLYPNPAATSAIVEFHAKEQNENAELEIYFFNKRISKSKVIVKPGFNQIFVDVSSYVKGFYLLSLKTENQILQAKFLKD